jgi:serine/arginine repetitive matrix protein 2
MRASADAGVPTLRKQDQQRPTSTVSGFGKSRSKAKGAPPKPLPSMLKSRMADSDDEGSEPRTFRSRFEDSSDEEAGVVKYRPVRGIPGKPDEGDSTDLDDSSDEGDKRTAKSRRQDPRSPEAINGVGKKAAKEPEISSSTERPTSPIDGKKKGIFSRFRSKKTKDSTGDAQPVPAEREVQLVPTSTDLNGARSPEFPASPDSKGKLQRRHIPQRMTSDSWPLPPKSMSDDGRPKTSDGTGSAEGANGRPGVGARQDTSGTVTTEGGIPIVGRTGRKKRFPMLRKAFGLHD